MTTRHLEEEPLLRSHKFGRLELQDILFELCGPISVNFENDRDTNKAAVVSHDAMHTNVIQLHRKFKGSKILIELLCQKLKYFFLSALLF